MYAALGRVLLDAREAQGAPQSRIADLAGISQSNVSRLERGLLVDAPRRLAEIIAAYAEATGVSENELLSRWGAEYAEQLRAEAARRARAKRRRKGR